MGFKSYCWSIGTTSFRVDQLNYKNECQLRYLNELFTSNPDMEWDKTLQAKYFDLLVSKDFIEDYDAIKDKDAREKTSGLADIGLVYRKTRHITPIGDLINKISLSGDFSSDNILEIPKDRCIGNFVKYGLDDEPNTIGYLEIYDIVKSKLKELMQSLKLNSDEFINNIVNKVDTDEHIKVLVSEKNKIVTRLNTIDSIIIRLYEDLVEEKLSGSNYQKMLDKYQDEQKKLNSQLIEIESKLTQENKTEENIETFKQIARKYIDFDELTPEIINNLISHITVSHVKVINGTKFREIKIIYKFIG